MKANEIMTRDVVTCFPNSGLEDVSKKMCDRHCGILPVVNEDGTLAGVVTDRDITCRSLGKGRNPLELYVKDVMTSDCVTVAPDADISECIRLLEDKQIRRVIVADEAGHCQGIIAQADLARGIAPEMAAELLREVSEPTEHASRVH